MALEFTNGPVALTPEAQATAEQALGLPWPDDYRAYMLAHNGGRVKPDTFDIHWRPGQPAAAAGTWAQVARLFYVHEGKHENLMRMNQITFKGRLPKGTLAIGRDPGSNLLLLRCDSSPQRGEVLYWLMEMESGGDNVGPVAASFDEFLHAKLR